MSVALFATADYVAARAAFYDATSDLDDAYRALIQSQSVMTEKHQAARDMVLRALPRGKGLGDRQRVMIWNMFVDMLQLLDTLVATHTDYAAPRALAGNDCLIFMRDALVKMSLELNRIALDVSRGRKVQYRSSAKAELRAIEYEIEQLKQQGFGEREPEMLALIIQVLRRLRNSTRIVDRLADHTAASPDAKLHRCAAHQQVAHALHLAPGIPLRPLDQQPAPGFAALPLRAARDGGGGAGDDAGQPLAVAGIFSAQLLDHADHRDHHETGFALTRQRNGWRLTGTVIGCVCALLLFNLTDSPEILFAVLLAACIMGNSLVQLNYMASAIFNTLFVVLVFHFVSPGTVSMSVIGERAIDTLIGCALALVCSYILPWWEARYLAAGGGSHARQPRVPAGGHALRRRDAGAGRSRA